MPINGSQVWFTSNLKQYPSNITLSCKSEWFEIVLTPTCNKIQNFYPLIQMLQKLKIAHAS